MNKPARFSKRKAEWIIILLFVLANLSWIARSTAPWPDGDSYAQAGRVLTAMEGGLPTTVPALRRFLRNLSHRGRPPLYQLIAIPFVMVFGTSQDAFAVVNLLLLPLFLFAVSRGAEELSHRQTAGFLAVMAGGSFAPLIHMTPIFREYYGGIAFSAVAVWLLLRLWRRRGVRDAWLAATSCAIALLMHPVAAYVLIVPMATSWLGLIYLAWREAASNPGTSRVSSIARFFHIPTITRGLLPASLVPAVLVGGWFLTFGKSLVLTASKLSGSWITAFRGAKSVSWVASRAATSGLWYAVTSPHALSWPMVILLIIGGLWLAVRGNAAARLCVVWLLAAYFMLGQIDTFNWYYGTFGLPLVAVLLGAGIMAIQARALRKIAVILLVGVSLVNCSMVMTGFPRFSSRMARVWGSRTWRSLMLSATPPTTGYWPFPAVVGRIVRIRDVGKDRRGPVCAFVGPALLAPPLGFARMRFWKGGNVRFSQVGSPYWGRAFPVGELLRSQWLVVARPLSRWERAQNPYQRALATMLKNLPDKFLTSHSLEATFALPNGGELALFRRISPVTVAEVDATMTGLHLAPKYITGGDLLAARLLETAGQDNAALVRLERAGAVKDQPPAVRVRILYEAARLLLKHGRRADARHILERAASLVPPWMKLPAKLLTQPSFASFSKRNPREAAR